MPESVSISFPHLGIALENLKNSFSIFGIDVAFYGLIIGLGMLTAMLLAFHDAKVSGQNVDDYLDLALFGIIFAIIGARIYYVIFEWDYYKDNLDEIFNLRKGGLAIYGGIIAGVIVCIILSNRKKISTWKMLDTGAIGLITGQMIGRWGNFFNREAYGGDTDSLFAMRININDPNVSVVVQNEVTVIDDSYIQVHPTFLYESFWCLCILILIQIFKRKKAFQGEVFLWYITAYAFGRFFIEGLRKDQLLINGTNIAVSQLLSAVLFVLGITLILLNRIRIAKNLSTVIVGKAIKEKNAGYLDKKFISENFTRKNIFSDKIRQAMYFAKNAHEGQTWKLPDGTDISYFEGHLMGVYHILEKEEAADEEMLVTALLHDILEDTSTKYKDLEKRFGSQVAENVKWLTRTKEVAYETYIDELLLNGSDIALIVKLADRLYNITNLMNLGNEEWHLKKTGQARYMIEKISQYEVLGNYKDLKDRLLLKISSEVHKLQEAGEK